MKAETLMKIQTIILLLILGFGLYYLFRHVEEKKWTYSFRTDVPEWTTNANEMCARDLIDYWVKTGSEVISVNRSVNHIGASDKFDILFRQ
jgi:hypothetical protein